MDVLIEPANEDDIPSLLPLLTELQDHYGAQPTASEIAATNIREAVFGDSRFAQVLVARLGRSVVGFAAYVFVWPASGTRKSVFIKEIYVSEGSRRLGVGRALMARVCNEARKSGCDRVDWTTDAGSDDALAFYQSLGTKPVTEKLYFRLEGEELKQHGNLT